MEYQESLSEEDMEDRVANIKWVLQKIPLSGDRWAKLGFTLQLKDTRFHESDLCQQEAIQAFKIALRLLDPFSNMALVVHYRMGVLYRKMGEYQAAIDSHMRIVNHCYFQLDQASNLYLAAQSMAALNRPVEALDHYRDALGAYPKLLLPYSGIVDRLIEMNNTDDASWHKMLQFMYVALGHNVVEYDDDCITGNATVLKAENSKAPFEVPSSFYFAMFTVSDILREYDQAWCLLIKAHEVQNFEKDHPNFSTISNTIASSTRTLKTVFNSGFWPNGVGHQSCTPVFIVEMLRSGSTMLESMLSEHSEIVSIGEDSALNHYLPSLLRQIHECTKTRPTNPQSYSYYFKIRKLVHEIGDEVVERMTAKACEVLNADPDKRFRKKSHRPTYIVDKMQANHKNIGLIHLVFPNAVVLHTIRDPMDTIFSCFNKKLDDGGLLWTIDFSTICSQYQAYLEVMDHWESTLPGRVHHVVYEDVVHNTEAEMKRVVCDILGLAWESDVLNTESNHTPAMQAQSVTEARKRLRSNAIGIWKNYSSMLLPLVKSSLKQDLSNIALTEKFPNLNWKFDINHQQELTRRESCPPNKASAPRVSKKDTLPSKVNGKLRTNVPPLELFSSLEKAVNAGKKCEQMLPKGSLGRMKHLISFDSYHFKRLTKDDFVDTENKLHETMTDGKNMLKRKMGNFIVDPYNFDHISLYCLMLYYCQKQIHLSGCRHSCNALDHENAIVHISYCVNIH